MSEYINKIICGDNIEVMKTLPDNSVDLIVTSPPYDNVRDYEGFNLDLHAVGEQAHRVLKDGGMCVMVIQDGTKNFGKTLLIGVIVLVSNYLRRFFIPSMELLALGGVRGFELIMSICLFF